MQVLVSSVCNCSLCSEVGRASVPSPFQAPTHASATEGTLHFQHAPTMLSGGAVAGLHMRISFFWGCAVKEECPVTEIQQSLHG